MAEFRYHHIYMTDDLFRWARLLTGVRLHRPAPYMLLGGDEQPPLGKTPARLISDQTDRAPGSDSRVACVEEGFTVYTSASPPIQKLDSSSHHRISTTLFFVC